MSLTRININTAYHFTQPELGETVVVRLDSGINWIEKDSLIFISKGGVYRVEDILGFNHTLKLIEPIAQPTEIVSLSFLWPLAQFFKNNEVVPSDNITQEIIETRSSETLIASEKALIDWAMNNYANRLQIKSPTVGATNYEDL